MSIRIPHTVDHLRARRRLTAGLVTLAGLTLAVSTEAGPASAQSVPTAELETAVLRIPIARLGSGARIPAGTALTAATLRTSDPDSGPQGLLGIYLDPTQLLRGEVVTLSVNGTRIATAMPELRAVALQTDAGAIRGLAFSAGGASYVIPQSSTPIGNASRVTTTSQLNTVTAAITITSQYGLLPVGATAVQGKALIVSGSGPSATRTIATRLLFDADGVRGTSDSAGEELIVTPAPAGGLGLARTRFHFQEVAVTVQLANGALVTVNGLVDSITAAYSPTVSTFLLDSAGLAGAGGSLDSVTAVIASTPVDHNANWSALGFNG